jgi:hypothetical protein
MRLEKYRPKRKKVRMNSSSARGKNPLNLIFGGLCLCLMPLLLSGCGILSGNGLRSEASIFRPLDDTQSWKGVFDAPSDGEKGFFSPHPRDYITDGVGMGVPSNLKRGWVISPWAPRAGLVDVRQYKPGEIVTCPFTGKPLEVPNDDQYMSVHVHR